MQAPARIYPPLVVLLLLRSSAVLAQTPTPSTWPGGGGCGSPNANCIPAVINGNWAALRRAADLGNSELTCYDPANAVQSGGLLNITLTNTPQTCYYGSQSGPINQGYTSDMIMTWPFNFLYGTVEARIKFGRGWPALWLLGGNAAAQTGCQSSNVISAENILTCNWDLDSSDSAEIDIAEFYEPAGYGSTSHHVFNHGGNDCGFSNVSPAADQAFHVYRMTWLPSSLSFTVDGTNPVGCTGSFVPSHPMFLMINDTLSTTNNSIPPSFPQVTSVDYVRVWDQSGALIFDDEFSGVTQTNTPSPTGTPTPTTAPIVTSTATVASTLTPIARPTATPSPIAGTVTIWGPTATPGNAADPDASAVELGVKFTSDVNGLLTGIRFYKGTTNTGTHTGTLWSSAGALLATATFSNETASGWQQVSFATPVAITANTVYVASYHTNVGHYAADTGYFAAAGVDNPPLHALRNGVSGGNGVYVYGASAFPTNTYQSTNYWVDVVFSAAGSGGTATATATRTRTRTPTAPATSVATPTATATHRHRYWLH